MDAALRVAEVLVRLLDDVADVLLRPSIVSCSSGPIVSTSGL